MTLHEAIVKLLRVNGKPMTTSDVAQELNKNKWYQKKDGSIITAYQIHGRTKNYTDLFNRDGNIVLLKKGHNTPMQIKLLSSNVNQIKIETTIATNKQSLGRISDDLIKEIQKCQECRTIKGYKKFPETSHGNYAARYLLVSEAPGKESLTKEKYWTGKGGQILRASTAAANTTLEQLFYLTDIVKCWPNEDSNNRTPTENEIMNCSHFLIKEIDDLKPKIILSLGKPASSFLLKRDVKVKLEHGKLFDYNKNTLVLVMLHPSGIDRQMDRTQYVKQLTSVFMKLKEGKTHEIEEIFK